jgi:hypothetical protein
MQKSILFICGSLNQTTMMHKISKCLSNDYLCYFSPFYADGFVGFLASTGALNFTILGGRHRKATDAYLEKENLPVDVAGRARCYDAVITCTDLIIPRNIYGKRLILVQEGMTEPEDFVYQLVRLLKLPRYLANTAAMGLSDAYDIFCVASPGYRDFFVKKGAWADKIVVTGIPNFDHAKMFFDNDLKDRNYILVATSSIRETMKSDNRISFLKNCKKIANGRRVVFKLHPNENQSRAKQEIHRIFPDAPIYCEGNINHMIANCDVLITQYSSAVYIGIALGKEVHSYYDTNVLRQMMPIQNGGTSAERISEICRKLVEIPVSELSDMRQTRRIRRKLQLSDAW